MTENETELDIELSDSNEFREGYSCDACRTIWYGQTESAVLGNMHASPAPNSYCPNCGRQNVERADQLPGVVLLPVHWRHADTDRDETDNGSEEDSR